MESYIAPEIKVTYFESDEVLTGEAAATAAPLDIFSQNAQIPVGGENKTIQKVAGIQFAG